MNINNVQIVVYTASSPTGFKVVRLLVFELEESCFCVCELYKKYEMRVRGERVGPSWRLMMQELGDNNDNAMTDTYNS
jgi:hypothetical protein